MNDNLHRPNPFAAGGLDRQSQRRADPLWVSQAIEAPTSRVTLVWRNNSLIETGDGPRPWLPTLNERGLRELIQGFDSADLILLGSDQQGFVFAVDVSSHEDPLATLPTEGVEFKDLRQVGGLLEPAEGSLLAYARAMATWHSRHRFCGRCGSPTQARSAGHLRLCSNRDCAHETFPRTDPAVIMLAHHGDRCLLGRQASWPQGIYSTLAGFVEPGESLEDAVRREIHEEAGIVVDECTYSSSQPWPFPSSLMLGFHARAVTTEVQVDGEELDDAVWFTRQQLLNREIRLPGKVSIARRLIEDWLRQ